MAYAPTLFSMTFPKALSLEPTFGGKPVDVLSIVAWHLGDYEADGKTYSLSEYAYLYGFAKFALDQNSYEKLRKMWEHRAEYLAGKWRWKYRQRDTLIRAGQVALEMHIDPQKWTFCKTCCGSGALNSRGSGVRVCDKCEGSGMRERPGSEFARFIGVDEAAWRRLWSERVNQLHKECAWETEIFEHVNGKVAREAL